MEHTLSGDHRRGSEMHRICAHDPGGWDMGKGMGSSLGKRASRRNALVLTVGVIMLGTAWTAARVDPWQSWSYDGFWSLDRALADPGALYADGEFSVYTTTDTHCVVSTCAVYWVPRFASSSMGATAGLGADALPVRPEWVAPADRVIWAPSVLRIGEYHVMYFGATAGTGANAGAKCVGVAVALVPEGPFMPLTTPLACGSPGYWALDPYVVSDGADLYLLWREDDPTYYRGKIVGAQLSADGVSFSGAPKRTLLVGEFPWEDADPSSLSTATTTGFDRRLSPAAEAADRDHGVANAIGPIENPAMAQHPETGEWLLTWSANSWNTQNYATGLAVCDGPLGPCARVSQESPWLRTSADTAITTSASFGGAGGLSFVTGPDGHLYAVFHAYRGAGNASTAPRIGWAYRVTSANGTYHLTEF